MTLRELILQRIGAEGPLSFTEYVDLALYHPALGYYARADRRSGRAGDFFTSVDLGPFFGELLAEQFAEMWNVLSAADTHDVSTFDFVEAAAGSGQLAHDVLNAAETHHPAFYAAVRLNLVDRSQTARGAHRTTLGRHATKLIASDTVLPTRTSGVIFANELLDALPPHVVIMTDDGLREIYVDVDSGRLVERIGPISNDGVRAHIERWNIHLEPGWRVEVNPGAVAWVDQAARGLDRGFLILIDYGHESTELYSAAHATGTLRTYHHHQVTQNPVSSTPAWLQEPGECDITTHVDLTAVRLTAERAGLTTLGVLDQTYFLLGLGVASYLETESSDNLHDLKRRLAIKSLLIPGGLGSTHKVLIFGKGVGSPQLAGCSYRMRAT